MDASMTSIENSTLYRILTGSANAHSILNETAQDLLLIAKEELTLVDLVKVFLVVIVILLIVNGCCGGVNASVIEKSRKKTKQYFQSLQQDGM